MLERIQKIIANSGYCSRRKAEELIMDGKVKVNDKPIKIGDKADREKDKISVNNQQIVSEKKVYVALNKPRGYITTSSDLYGRKKVIDLIDIEKRVFPVGRLDRDATGLLLLTNDGEFSNKIMHPSYEVEKKYLATLDKPFEKEDRLKIEKGIKLKDGFVKGKIKIVDKKRVELTIHEGKNKIVKRIFNHVGYNVKELCRIKIGKLALGSLKAGKFRFLTKKEIDFFR